MEEIIKNLQKSEVPSQDGLTTGVRGAIALGHTRIFFLWGPKKKVFEKKKFVYQIFVFCPEAPGYIETALFLLVPSFGVEDLRFPFPSLFSSFIGTSRVIFLSQIDHDDLSKNIMYKYKKIIYRMHFPCTRKTINTSSNWTPITSDESSRSFFFLNFSELWEIEWKTDYKSININTKWNKKTIIRRNQFLL